MVTTPSKALTRSIRGLIASSTEPLGERSVYKGSATASDAKIASFLAVKLGGIGMLEPIMGRGNAPVPGEKSQNSIVLSI